MSTFQQLYTILENAGHSPRDYSGRGMYGRKCLGVVCSNETQLILEVMTAAVEEYDGDSEGWSKMRDVIEALEGPKTDSMGRSIIVYWPNVEWE